MSTFSIFSSLSLLCFVTCFLVLPQNSQSLQYYGQNLYNSCIPKSCGNESISYPFYIVDQQNPRCGYPGFNLMCPNKTPVINISGGKFIIQDIFYQNQSVRVSYSAFLDSNCSSIDNLQFLTLSDPGEFMLAHNYSTVTLLVNCSNGKVHKGRQVYNVTCKRNGNDEEVIWAAYHGQGAGFPKCADGSGSPISVPYEGGNSPDVGSVLRRGIILNWTADNCTPCESSGGRCGWDDSRFLCYCPDRVHANDCTGQCTRSHESVNGSERFMCQLVICFLGCSARYTDKVNRD